MAAPPQLTVPLDSGDRLTRAEFHRRYLLRPDVTRAELIFGVVYVSPSPVSPAHGEPHGDCVTWLGVYAAQSSGVRMMDNVTTLLLEDSEVQPDAFLFHDPPPPGGARDNGKGAIVGPPQLVVEIAVSSASYDLHDKKELYRRAGVEEYVVRRVLDGAIDWFRLVDGDYVRVEPDTRGVIESSAFPGLRLAVDTMLAGDLAGVLAELTARPA
jgi:Uma2 family endonuclease